MNMQAKTDPDDSTIAEQPLPPNGQNPYLIYSKSLSLIGQNPYLTIIDVDLALVLVCCFFASWALAR